MPKSTPIFDNQFWKVLRFLDELSQEISFEELKSILNYPEMEAKVLFEVIAFLKNFDYEMKVQSEGSQLYIYPDLKKKRVMIDMSFSEWLAFQAHFPLLGKYAGTQVHTTVAQKLNEVELHYPELDLFHYVEQEEGKREVISKMDDRFAQFVCDIDNSLSNGLLLSLVIENKNSLEIFPHKLVYIDGDLSLIGEETKDRCLVSLSVSSIRDVEISVDTNYRNNFSSKEIDDFIYAIRSVSGNEERLVMKVNSNEKIDLKPPFHFLGNPYITSNMEGELIWAASVEVSNELLEWISGLGSQVEVLDPPVIKEALNEFIETNNRNPLKKAG